MSRRLHGFLARLRKWAVGTLAAMLIVLLGAIDQLTGYQLSFSVFYLAPISIAAWYGSRAMGYAASTMSAATWLVVEKISAVPYSEPWIVYWNTGVRFLFFIIVAWLVAELNVTLRRHQQLARTDQLTGLLNRAGFIDHAGPVVAAASRYGHPTSLAYIDLDGFKSINDNMGHAQGDEVLKLVGQRLLTASRGSDIVARLGGDEFAVLLPNTDLAGARAYFGKLHDLLNEETRQRGWQALGFSIGAIVFDKGPPRLGDALRLADDLMYRAKKSAGILVEAAPPVDAAPLHATDGQ
jgi:diguanylate cyclase (GGDEF)-like protein